MVGHISSLAAGYDMVWFTNTGSTIGTSLPPISISPLASQQKLVLLPRLQPDGHSLARPRLPEPPSQWRHRGHVRRLGRLHHAEYQPGHVQRPWQPRRRRDSRSALVADLRPSRQLVLALVPSNGVHPILVVPPKLQKNLLYAFTRRVAFAKITNVSCRLSSALAAAALSLPSELRL